MKAIVKQVAAGTFIALLLMVGSVDAKNFKASSSKIAETTLQMENWMTNETKPAMKLENWMKCAKAWNRNSIFIKEVEAEMELESWMTDAITWNTNYRNIAEFVVETETSMKLENWMTSAKTWNINSIFVE